MRIAMIIVRTLMGLLFVFASVGYLLLTMGMFPAPVLEGANKTFNEGLAATGYFFPFLKITEFVCSLLLLSGRFVPLALVILSPIILNIFFVHILVDQSGMVVGVLLVAANIFLAYCYRDAFKPLLTPNYAPYN